MHVYKFYSKQKQILFEVETPLAISRQEDRVQTGKSFDVPIRSSQTKVSPYNLYK